MAVPASRLQKDVLVFSSDRGNNNAFTPTKDIVKLQATNPASDQNALLAFTAGSDVSTGKVTLSLPSDSTTGSVISGLALPTSANHAASKAYVDNVAAGLDVKQSVKTATDPDDSAVNITISSAPALINGVTLSGSIGGTNNDRVLLTTQTVGSQNGIWVFNGENNALTRPTDFLAGADAAGAFVFVQQGGGVLDKGLVCTNDTPNAVIDTNNLTFTKFSGSAGGGDANQTLFIQTSGGLTGGMTSASDGNVTETFVLNPAASNSGFISNAADASGEAKGLQIQCATANINASAVTKAKIASDVAGLGLAQHTDGSLRVATLIQRDATEADDDNQASITLKAAQAANATDKNTADAKRQIRVMDAGNSADGVASEETFSVLANGTCTGNEFIADSDRRLKKNITPLPTSAALQAVAAMGPVTYEFKNRPGDPRCGVIAQELAEIAPELVKHTQKGTLAVDYNDMNAYLIGAIQALKSQVEEQADVIQRLSQSIPVAAL